MSELIRPRHALMAMFATSLACISTPVIAQTASFSLSAQPASSGLTAFAKQAGIQILASGAVVQGKRTNKVRGRHTVDSALAILLKDTGLIANRSLGSPNIFTIQAASSAAEPAVSDSSEAREPEITVTGTRITGAESSAAPIVSVTADDLLNSSNPSLGDALKELPALQSSFTNAASTGFQGTAGLNLLDLRNLGLTRTLVLLNGRRHVTSSAGQFFFDVSSIPNELLERVDIVTGGNSAVYGSDAIAGVVNFITKRDFEGLTGNVQGSISSRGDRGIYAAGLTAGKNFADGRANLSGAIEYVRIANVKFSDRPGQSGSFEGVTGFQQTSNSGEDGVPDLTFEANIRNSRLSSGGTFSTQCFLPSQQLGCDSNGLPRLFRFGTDGRLAPASEPRRELRQIDGQTQLGGDGQTGERGSLFPAIERFNANLLGRFEVSDAFKPFVEVKFSRLKAAAEGGSSFSDGFCNGTVDGLQGQIFGIAGVENNCSLAQTGTAFISFDNAFLNPDDANTIAAIQNEFTDVLVDAVFGVPNVSAFFPSNGFFINRINNDFGGRDADITRDIYRAVVGASGRFNDDWIYEIGATYGRFDGRVDLVNNLVTQRFRNAIDAVRAPGGQIVCRINADVSTANDDAACVPLNILGTGSPSRAALDYVQVTGEIRERAEQINATAFIKGDTSQLFSLPGGPVTFVLGGEYRRETTSRVFDELSASGATFTGASEPFNPPAFGVTEVFGELVFPILGNLPFANNLTVSLAGRISDYNAGAGSTGTTKTYNAGIVYSPVADIRFRASYSRAVRAPTPGDLFASQQVIFVGLNDPCSVENIGFSATRVANCRADGVPVGFRQSPNNDRATTGGNPELEAETSKSFTAGINFQPSFLRGLSISVDYYDIKVTNLLEQVSGSAVLTNCYDAPNIDNRFCRLIAQRQADGSFNADSALFIGTANFAKQTARGIDAEVRFERTFDNGDRMSLSGLGTYFLNRVNFIDPDNPDLPNRILSELGNPVFSGLFQASYTRSIFTFGYDLRYIGRQTIGNYENYFAFNGEEAVNPDFTLERFYPNVFYHDVRLSVDVNEKFNLTLGVDNLTDRLPPFGLLGTGGGDAIFDNIGRAYYARVRFKL